MPNKFLKYVKSLTITKKFTAEKENELKNKKPEEIWEKVKEKLKEIKLFLTT